VLIGGASALIIVVLPVPASAVTASTPHPLEAIDRMAAV
jgi:hypothetical protein